ncbi:MAG TPA: 4-hydroxy-3-methylbut-2-enyl diphosphate reductase [Candidatus Methylomirabilis sp.]|nr:4-hydroxy-3-methylbut-2-enyl diphosphate reductase [Candidatus Methylomirabilis sp.]
MDPSTRIPMTVEKIVLARPRGFCAGVDRAIDVVRLALQMFPGPIYVRREIVHNAHVVQELRREGAIFVEELDEVPPGATVIFSAHGVSPEVFAQAKAKRLRVIDATCPLVTKVHNEAVRYAREGRTIFLIGHEGHDEVIGTTGEAPDRILLVGSEADVDTLDVPDSDNVAVITQTTLSVDDTQGILDALKRRFPSLKAPHKDDICYATQNRQTAVKALARAAELILVVGSDNSSNSTRLREVAEACGTPAHLIDDVSEIEAGWLQGPKVVGITSGASAPEHLVQALVSFFRAQGVQAVEEIELVPEDVHFALPAELMAVRPRGAA